MKKSLMILAVGVAAFGFAKNAQATYTAEVSGTMGAVTSSTDTNAKMAAAGFGGIAGVATNTTQNTKEFGTVEAGFGKNQVNILLSATGAGTIGGSAAFDSFGLSSKNDVTVSSVSTASMSAVDGSNNGGFTVGELSSVRAVGYMLSSPALGDLTGKTGIAESSAFIGMLK